MVVEALAQVFLWPGLVALDMPSQTIRMTERYLRIIYAGLPLVMGFNLFSGFLRSVGNSVTPLIAMVCASLTNIVLDFLYVMGLGWGVEGAAIATITGQGLSCIICLISVLRTPVLHIDRGDLRFDGQTLLLIDAVHSTREGAFWTAAYRQGKLAYYGEYDCSLLRGNDDFYNAAITIDQDPVRWK